MKTNLFDKVALLKKTLKCSLSDGRGATDAVAGLTSVEEAENEVRNVKALIATGEQEEMLR